MKSSPTPHCSVNNTRQPSFLPKPHTQFTTPKQSLTQHRETIHAGSQQARAPLQPSTSGQGFTPSYKPCSFKISPPSPQTASHLTTPKQSLTQHRETIHVAQQAPHPFNSPPPDRASHPPTSPALLKYHLFSPQTASHIFPPHPTCYLQAVLFSHDRGSSFIFLLIQIFRK